MESLCTLSNGRIRPRHRRHAELLLDKVLSPGEAFDPLVGLATALAPSLDINAIVMGTINYRISVEILDQEALAKLIGLHRLEAFYSEIEDAYAWNSRYWEQRALAASQNREHNSAKEFVRKALDAHRDGFSLNTCAAVHLKALWASGADASRAEDEYWSLVPLMREARDLSRPDSEYPYVTFFSGTIRLARVVRRNDVLVSRAIIREWADWEDKAARSMAFRDPIGQKNMADFREEWLKAAVTDPTV